MRVRGRRDGAKGEGREREIERKVRCNVIVNKHKCIAYLLHRRSRVIAVQCFKISDGHRNAARCIIGSLSRIIKLMIDEALNRINNGSVVLMHGLDFYIIHVFIVSHIRFVCTLTR